MIVGVYSLDLYCENENHVPRFPGDDRPGLGEFLGRTRSQCARQARKLGWVINFKTGKCHCPECKKFKASNKEAK
jgi:hypothetical protein